jgi:hypothetical protein
MAAIIIQVKNAMDYDATLQGQLFGRMDTIIKSAMFGVDPDPESESESTPAGPKKKRRRVAAPDLKPVIRIVFALASPDS